MWHHLCAIKLLLLRKKSLFETNQNQNCNNYNKQTHLASFSRGQNRQIRQNKLIGENRKPMKKGKINWDIFIHEKRMQPDKDASFFYIHHFDFKE